LVAFCPLIFDAPLVTHVPWDFQDLGHPQTHQIDLCNTIREKLVPFEGFWHPCFQPTAAIEGEKAALHSNQEWVCLWNFNSKLSYFFYYQAKDCKWRSTKI
jgi:hypothetical protein